MSLAKGWRRAGHWHGIIEAHRDDWRASMNWRHPIGTLSKSKRGSKSLESGAAWWIVDPDHASSDFWQQMCLRPSARACMSTGPLSRSSQMPSLSPGQIKQP